MGIIIRKAKILDINSCVSISKVPELTTLYKMSKNQAKKYLLEFYNKGILIVAEDNNQIIGFISGELMLGKFVWGDGAVVVKEYQGRGVGKKLFSFFVKEAKKKGVKYIYNMAPKFNKSTIGFYKSLGLKQGNDFVEFSKKL